MNQKRWLEVGSGLLLLMMLVVSIGGYTYWKLRRDQATSDLLAAIQQSNTIAMRDAILRGADVQASSSYPGGPWKVAAMANDPELLRLLHDRGADPNARDSRGMTPLMWQPSYRAAELLLSYGADPNATDSDGESVLACVVWKDDEESLRLARLLLEHGAKPRPRDLRAAQGSARMTALLKGGAGRR